MKIALIVEGKTEQAFLPHFRAYLARHLEGNMPKFKVQPYHGLIPTGAKLQRVVANHLADGQDAVIALTDVYTGHGAFTDAFDAIAKLQDWADHGPPQFHAHAAQHDFEAWLLPYWTELRTLARSNRNAPGGSPESVNHNRPPAKHLGELFETGQGPRSYNKPRDAYRILSRVDLQIAIDACPQLRSLVNTVINLCGGTPL